jgi:hypothetical protein
MKRTLMRVCAATLITILSMLTFAIPSAARADPSYTLTFVNHGMDVCTGDPQTTTIVVDFYEHDTNVTIGVRTITTDTGYVGRGESTVVNNGEVLVMSLHDMLVKDSGARVRVSGTIILDASTTPPTPKVINVERTCVQQ